MHHNDAVTVIRCRADNYAYLLHDDATGDTVLIDAPEAGPIRAELSRRGWRLSHILLTHHHDDHVAGLADLRNGAEVIGARADAHRLPPLDRAVTPAETIATGTGDFTVLAADGHTLGHIAFHHAGQGALFSGDSLMVHGCGRLFEGTPDRMHATISAMNRLPDETRIWSGHDYAAANLAFAATMAPDPGALADRQRAVGILTDERRPTVGVTLAEDRAINPYLRVDLPQVQAAAGLSGGDPVAVFAAIRAAKDGFRG